MRKLLGYILTPVHLLFFGLGLIIFHPIQWICLKIGGYQWHKKSVDYLNLWLTNSLWFLGGRARFIQPHVLPVDRPIIVVSNHQSLYDIPPFFWYLRRHHMKFVAKIELTRGIPSVSFNLRHGGSAVIDRKDPRQSLPALKNFAKYIEKNNYGACIFPEGTRGRRGAPKKFSTTGLKILMKYAPSAVVVPITINDCWKLNQYGRFPMPAGISPTWLVHPYIDPKDKTVDEVLALTEKTIKDAVRN